MAHKKIISLCIALSISIFGVYRAVSTHPASNAPAYKAHTQVAGVFSAHTLSDDEIRAHTGVNIYWPVERVVDGDTVIVDITGVSERVRLLGINTPETVDPRKPVECFGKAASDEAKRILTGSQVSLELDSSQGLHDKYGRLLAYLQTKDGLFFNNYMIERGYAYEYTYNLPYKYQKDFKKAQIEAEIDKRGLWAPDVCKS